MKKRFTDEEHQFEGCDDDELLQTVSRVPRLPLVFAVPLPRKSILGNMRIYIVCSSNVGEE
jgi:hypothetical protein